MQSFSEFLIESDFYFREFGWITKDGKFIDGMKAKKHYHVELLPPNLIGKPGDLEDYTKVFPAGWIRFYITSDRYDMVFHVGKFTYHQKDLIQNFLFGGPGMYMTARSWGLQMQTPNKFVKRTHIGEFDELLGEVLEGRSLMAASHKPKGTFIGEERNRVC